MPRFTTSSTNTPASMLLALVASAALLAAAQASSVASVPRPTTTATTSSSGRGGSGRGYHSDRYKTCVGAEIDYYGGHVTSSTCGGKYDQCCEGWLCKTDKPLAVEYPVREQRDRV